MTKLIPTIGMEIHAELKTNTKMFCRCINDANETSPNVNICPVCMAHPGTLPVINREAVRHVLKVGLAINAKLADYTEWDRKNYFYPDLPKGYQLSQFEYPLISGGTLADVAITRIHLEEDTASSVHEDATHSTHIDYNRAGVPLMELVSEPVIRSAEQAGNFARELQLLLRYLGVSDADMEKGQMRVEANISVSEDGGISGTKTEVKNLNSFRIMEKAIEYEIKRQTALIENGEKVIQQTLGWDDAKGATFPQRMKEGSADYRYFPDPDLPSARLTEIPDMQPAILRKEMGVLPWEKREKYLGWGIKKEDAEQFVRDASMGQFFDTVVELVKGDVEKIKLAANYLGNDVASLIKNGETAIEKAVPATFVALVELVGTKKLSSRSAKDLLKESLEGRDPEAMAKERSLFQESNEGALETTVQKVIADNPKVADEVKAGKAAGIEFLLGQCMKQLRGAGDPNVLRGLLKKNLGV